MRIAEQVKIDTAIKPQSLATTNATGAYHQLKEWAKACFVGIVAAMAKTKTVVFQVYEATDSKGTGAQALTGLTCTITANTKVTSLTVAASSVIATDEITVTAYDKGGTAHAQSFVCTASGGVAADGEFDVGLSDTATMDNFVTALHACLGDYLYGVNSAGTVTVTAREIGESCLTAVSGDATITVATLEALAYIEINPGMLSSGFSHVALKATTDATIVVGAELLREGRFSPVQQVAAYDVAA